MEARSGETVRLLLEEAGADDALADALAAAGLERVPDEQSALVRFLDGPLVDALVGRLHPTTAGGLVARIREEIVDRMGSGRRPRPERASAEEPLVPTMPPPSDEEAQRAYEELASGAIHDRATPTWGLRRPSVDSLVEETIWIVISTDDALLEATRRGAPSGTEVIVASSMAVLKGALGRLERAGSVVIDAAAPSMPLDRSLAALTEHIGAARVVLWRMPIEERERLSQAMPHVRGWLPCDAEVTPPEIVQLLGA